MTLEFGILTEVVESIVHGLLRQVETFPFFMYANILVCVKMATYSETHEYVNISTCPLDHILILVFLHCSLATLILCGGCQAKILCALLISLIVPSLYCENIK